MKQKIEVDTGIRDLVNTLNQIKGVRTFNSCDGHGADIAFVRFHTDDEDKMEMLLHLALKQPGVIVTQNGLITLRPTWAGKPLSIMQRKLRRELEERGLLTEENPFELGDSGETEITWPPVADFSDATAQMTAGKLEKLKSFAYNVGIAYLEKRSTSALENAHKAYMVGFKKRTLTNGWPIMSGTIYTGRFCHSVTCNKPEHSTKMFYMWRACWEAKRLLAWLFMQKIPMAPGEHTIIELVDPVDLEDIHFVNDKQLTESVALIHELLA